MSTDLANPDITLIAVVAAIMTLGGFVKGTVGFALPIVGIAGLGLFLTAQEAIAIIMVPSAVSNLWQTLRQGWAAAVGTFRRSLRINLPMAAVLVVTAQFVPRIESQVLFIILGVTICLIALVQLLGWRPRVSADTPHLAWIEVGIGLIAGVIGGLTGVWGPLVLYWLIALSTEKRDQVRMLGLNFLIGWSTLVAAHVGSGVLNTATFPISAAMLVPAVIGMWLGLKLQDRVDQQVFLRLTLAVLCIAGLNLLRRGLV